jgi:hypothetical protein
MEDFRKIFFLHSFFACLFVALFADARVKQENKWRKTTRAKIIEINPTQFPQSQDNLT